MVCENCPWVAGCLVDGCKARAALEETRAEKIDYLYCGHCGGIEDVRSVDFREGNIRHLCRLCRASILEWILNERQGTGDSDTSRDGRLGRTGSLVRQEKGHVVMENCDHHWEPGDLHSDFICAHCGERSDIPEWED